MSAKKSDQGHNLAVDNGDNVSPSKMRGVKSGQGEVTMAPAATGVA